MIRGRAARRVGRHRRGGPIDPAGAVALHTVARWFVGYPATAGAAVHFAGLPVPVATAVVGAWAGAYHRAVLGDDRGAPQGAYPHLVAAVGLLAAAAGMALAIVAALRAMAPTRPHRHVLLVSADGRALGHEVAARTGATVRTLHRLDAHAQHPDADGVVAAVLAAPHDRLLVTVDDDGSVHTIPYEHT